MTPKFLNWAGVVVCIITTLLSFLLFYYDTQEMGKSLVAGLLTGGLVLGTYMILRWLILATR